MKVKIQMLYRGINMYIFSRSKHTVRNDSEKETSVTKSSSDELRIVTEALSVVLR